MPETITTQNNAAVTRTALDLDEGDVLAIQNVRVSAVNGNPPPATPPAWFSHTVSAQAQDVDQGGTVREMRTVDFQWEALNAMNQGVASFEITAEVVDGAGAVAEQTWQVTLISENVYASSTGGDDANSGATEAVPVQALLAARQKLNTATVVRGYLERGSYWRERMTVNAGEAVRAYGTGAMPVVDQADLIDPSAWSPHPTIPNVYQITLATNPATGNTNRMNWWMETAPGSGTQLATRVPTEADLENTPGAYHQRFGTEAEPLTLSIHPYGSTDPRTDGKAYELVVRSGVRVNDGGTMEGIETFRNTNNNGSITGQANVFINRCLAREGTKHSSFMISGETRDSVAYASDTPYPAAANGYVANEPSQSAYVAYSADATGLEVMWRRCHAVQPDARADARGNGWQGFLAHSSNDPDDRYAAIRIRGGSVYRHRTALGGVADLIDVRGLQVRQAAIGAPKAASHTYTHNVVEWSDSEPVLEPNTIGTGVPCLISQNAMTGDVTGSNSKRGMISIGPNSAATIENNILYMQGADVLGLEVEPGATATVRYNIIVPNTQSNTSGIIWNVPSSGFTSDYNIFVQMNLKDFVLDGALIDLFDWLTASGQDQNSVFVGHDNLWITDPATGDFRLNPNCPCNPLNGDPQRVGEFADGTPITQAGVTEVWDPTGGTDGLGAPVAGTLGAWPTTPRTLAESRAYCLDPTAWVY